MNKLLGVLAAGIFMFSGAVSAQTLTIGNVSSSDITAIYISESGADNWEENLIEGYVLPAGNKVDVEINTDYKFFDLRVEAASGSDKYTELPGTATQILLKGGGQSEYQ